MINQPFVPRAQ